MSQKLIGTLILFHFIILVVIGFFFYGNTYVFYGGVQISTILIYVVSKQDLSERNKILINGLLLMTILETLDYIWLTNTNYLKSSFILDGLIVFITVIITTIRYYKNGKINR